MMQLFPIIIRPFATNTWKTRGINIRISKYQDGILVWAQDRLTSNRAEEHHTQASVQETAALLELRHNIFLECFKLHSDKQLLVQEPKPEAVTTRENGEVSGIEFAEMRREIRHMKAKVNKIDELEARVVVLENDKAHVKELF